MSIRTDEAERKVFRKIFFVAYLRSLGNIKKSRDIFLWSVATFKVFAKFLEVENKYIKSISCQVRVFAKERISVLEYKGIYFLSKNIWYKIFEITDLKI